MKQCTKIQENCLSQRSGRTERTLERVDQGIIFEEGVDDMIADSGEEDIRSREYVRPR
jgi:hypothetical protein